MNSFDKISSSRANILEKNFWEEIRKDAMKMTRNRVLIVKMPF